MQAVLDNINKDTFGSYLDVASSHRLERLEAKCIDYLLANFNKVYTCVPQNSPNITNALRTPVHMKHACRSMPSDCCRHHDMKLNIVMNCETVSCAVPEVFGRLQADTQATLRRLSPVTLMAVLRSDNLRVPSEMHVFNSVVSWLEADSTRLEQVCCPE